MNVDIDICRLAIMDKYSTIKRNFGPVYDSNSRLLILGSFPSVKSREQAFFYAHPQNRFWRLMSLLLQQEIPDNIDEKRAILLNNNIALWDTIEQCDIVGSSDSSIRNVVPVDIHRVLDSSNIQAIFCNGATSHKLFMKYIYPICHIQAVLLPSTSPANAVWTLDRLYEAWSTALMPYIKK